MAEQTSEGRNVLERRPPGFACACARCGEAASWVARDGDGPWYCWGRLCPAGAAFASLVEVIAARRPFVLPTQHTPGPAS